MFDPVIAEDGNTYERAAILEWLENNGSKPNTHTLSPDPEPGSP
jgi:hypothetical protein